MNPQTVTRRTVAGELASIRDELGYVPDAVVAELADEVGRSPRTLRRWEAASRGEETASRRRANPQLDDTALEVLFAAGGNVAKAHRMLADAGVEQTRSLRTLYRDWGRVDSAVRAMATGGATELMSRQLRNRHDVDRRNQRWALDAEEAPVWVLPRGRQTPEKPWLLFAVDHATRVIVSWARTWGQPSSETVTATLADAIRLTPTTVPGVDVGGVPGEVLSDNGGEYRSEHYTQCLAALGITRRLTFPYMKHQNGKVERLNRTTQDELLSDLPGWTGGPRTLKLRDLYGADAEILGEEAFDLLVADWVVRYNSERPHQALDGQTPLQAWCADTEPLREADPEALRLAMLVTDRDRTIHPTGIRFRRTDYTSAALTGHVGRAATIRYLPHDDREIEVYLDGEWLCTARPYTHLDPEEQRRIDQARRDQYTAARNYLTAAAERRDLAVDTTSGTPRLRSPAGVVRPSSLADGDDDLLDLADPLETPRPRLADDTATDDTHRGDSRRGGHGDAAAGDADPWEYDPDAPDDPGLLDDLADHSADDTDDHGDDHGDAA